jgi:hypothetical protein
LSTFGAGWCCCFSSKKRYPFACNYYHGCAYRVPKESTDGWMLCTRPNADYAARNLPRRLSIRRKLIIDNRKAPFAGGMEISVISFDVHWQKGSVLGM